MNPNTTSPVPGAADVAANTAVQTEQISKLFNPNSTLVDLFNGLFFAAIAIGAILAVLRLGYAGIMYMTSDVWGKKSHAKEIIQNAVLGVLLLLAVWLILFQINPDILSLKILQPRPAETGGTNTGGLPLAN